MKTWRRGVTPYEGDYISTDGVSVITHEPVPESCDGPHPQSDGSYCYGDEIHYPLRWVLSEHDDMVGVFYTFREAKANA